MAAATRTTLAVRVAHASPGRWRLRVSRADLESGVAAEASAALDSQAHVFSARINDSARCIIVHYDERHTSTQTLMGALGDSGIVLRLESGSVAAQPAGAPPLSRWLSRGAQQADERVFSASSGATDLRTLLPVSLAALAVREILAGRGTAVPWYALAWYAFESFVKLRRPAQPSDADSR